MLKSSCSRAYNKSFKRTKYSGLFASLNFSPLYLASKSHFVVGYCLRFYVETRFEAYFLIIFEAAFSKREILQPRYSDENSMENASCLI
jgi:hypothetical protein